MQLRRIMKAWCFNRTAKETEEAADERCSHLSGALPL
jgi:hypothetical protein